jgi:AcrR family transcriptional regulator
VNTTDTRKRPYHLKQRALRQDETRQRIVDATVKLHTSVGPARTTVKAIAELAGVERLTVYRHFPNVDLLLEACTARGRLLWPPPQPALWVSIADPRARLKAALRDVYGYYQKRGDGFAAIMRDINTVPAWLQKALLKQQQAMIEVLIHGRRDQSSGLVRAAIGHAINFYTYRSLVHDQGLKIKEAIELMVQFVSQARK